MKKIIFVSELEGLELVEKSKPQPASKFIPDWYKDMPIDIPERTVLNNFHISKIVPNFKTAKTCPNFAKVFHEGYVLVAPCDILIGFDNNNQRFMQSSNSDFFLDYHDNDQFVHYAPNTGVRGVFKITTRWNAITPKGYSMRYIPMFWHFNRDWTACYGSIDQDRSHQLNIQILYTSEKDELLIKQGEPLCYLIPYKREKFSWTIEYMTDAWKRKLEAARFRVRNSFKAGYLKNEI
jgi:hypothetical protein